MLILDALYDIAQAYQEYKTQAMLFGVAGTVIYFVYSLFHAFAMFFSGKEPSPSGGLFCV